jgi:hypothetical protein
MRFLSPSHPDRVNSHFAICCLANLDDGHNQVRITGVAEVVTDRALLQEIWDANPLLRQYLQCTQQKQGGRYNAMMSRGENRVLLGKASQFSLRFLMLLTLVLAAFFGGWAAKDWNSKNPSWQEMIQTRQEFLEPLDSLEQARFMQRENQYLKERKQKLSEDSAR